MDRSFWISILLLALSLALVLSGRAILEANHGLHGEALLAEIDALEGRPSSVALADRVTEAAGCIRGFRPEVRSCWYVWAEPSRPDYLRVVAQRVRDDGGGEATRWTLAALPFWLLAGISAWKATRPKRAYRPRPIMPSGREEQPPRRLVS